MQDYRKLRVWRHAHELALAVRLCCRAFPRTGYASLHAQTTRAAESIVFNIVEGCGSSTPRDFARFLDTSIKSTFEVEGQLELAKDYGIVPETTWCTISTHATEVRRMLWGLRAKVLGSGPTNKPSIDEVHRTSELPEREWRATEARRDQPK